MTIPYYMIQCTDCGKNTTKAYASKNKGRCKTCVTGKSTVTSTSKASHNAWTKPIDTGVNKKKQGRGKASWADCDVPQEVLYTRNFKGYGSHWQAEIFEDGLGWSAIVKCISSKNWPVGYSTFLYNFESVEKLCEWIKEDLKERETLNGILYHGVFRGA
jgi:hypothetical protein